MEDSSCNEEVYTSNKNINLDEVQNKNCIEDEANTNENAQVDVFHIYASSK